MTPASCHDSTVVTCRMCVAVTNCNGCITTDIIIPSKLLGEMEKEEEEEEEEKEGGILTRCTALSPASNAILEPSPAMFSRQINFAFPL